MTEFFQKIKYAGLVAIIVLAGFGLGKEASAQTFYATGTLASKNVLLMTTASSLDYFGYLATTTATTTLKVQFSQDKINWYSSTNTLDNWDVLEHGDYLEMENAISLSDLDWAGPYFYYRVLFETSDTSQTPILGETRIYYTKGDIPTVNYVDTTIYVGAATFIGEITDNGGGAIYERGFQYGLTETPTWSVSETGFFLPGEDTYSLFLDDLDPETTYYVRAYAVNAEGTAFSEWESFTTLPSYQFSYYDDGYLVSKNLLAEEEDIVIINNFHTSSIVPNNTALWIQFSTSTEAWYSAEGVEDQWTFVPDGEAKFILYDLEWSGSNFYYKMRFESHDQESSPVLEEITLNFNLFHSPHLKGNVRIRGGTIFR